MPAINRETFTWSALGTRPAAGDEIYTPGEQPIASYDNWWNWAVSQDLEALDTSLGEHSARHEADGEDELDLNGLTVNGVMSFTGDEATNELRLIDESDGSTVGRIDMDAGTIYAWPAFGVAANLNQGGRLGGNLTRQDTGTVIYDYATGKVAAAVEADHADTADHATTAGDADTLDGNDSTAFIRPADATVGPTGKWTFAQTVTGDIDGNAATADHADDADAADYATIAGDSDTVDGYHAQQLIDAARQAGEWNHITTATSTTIGERWDWSHTSDTTYDRYRIRVYHESHHDWATKAFFWMKVGQNGVWDNRDTRYKWRERDLANDRYTEHASHGWTVASCWAGDMSVSTYYISCPRAVNAPDNHYPVVSTTGDEVSSQVPRTFDHGHLATDYPTINSFRLYSAYDTSTGKIVLDGQDL